MGNLAVQKLIYLLDSDEIVRSFSNDPTFQKADDVSFCPADLLAIGSWRNHYVIGTARGYRKLVPAIIFLKDNGILVKRTQEGNYRIWFGDPIQQETFFRYKTTENLVMQTVKKKKIHIKDQPDLIGYCTYKGSRIRNDFLIVYAAQAEKVPDKKTEQWIPITKIYTVYPKLDPLSKAIFDAIYEDKNLIRQIM